MPCGGWEKKAAAGRFRPRSIGSLPPFFAHPNWSRKNSNSTTTNRPVAYAPAEKERSANANAIKFAADLLAGGVAGGISKTGAVFSMDVEAKQDS